MRAVLAGAVSEVCDRAGTPADQLKYAFFGLPAYGEVRRDVPAIDAAVADAVGSDRFRCDNDMVCGWAGSLGGADGINVISGTGSMTYGERAGVRARVGGWGELIGDEGSGYWIGVRALRTFSQMSDGRRPPGPLADVLRERLELVDDVDLIDLVTHQWRADRARVAALSRPVVEAARRGDADAAAILADAGHELAALVEATRRRLGYGADEPVPVSYSGGVFGADEVRQSFAAGLASAPADYRLQPPLYPPVIGAALYAARLAGQPLAAAARAALRQFAQVRST
jgi:N-acetylglucosamine kinase-like BadF-type ATPase